MVRRSVAALLAAGAVTSGSTAFAVPAVATGGAPAWRADLSKVDSDDVNVQDSGGALTLSDSAWHRTDLMTAGSEGYLISAEQPLASAVNRVTAGAQPATFRHAVTVVQTRISLSSKTDGVRPAVREVDLSGSLAPQADALASTTPLTYTIYATREGLVGHTTANGHVITSNDHFVALPSGKATSAKGTGTYSVKVCRTDGSRREYAPVWDVGPWNTKDDLGYTVGNPAGIDLADGTFGTGLGLGDNGNVKVTYLWTGTSAASGTVSTAGDPVNVRASTTTSGAIKGLAANYAKVPIECYVNGDSVTGKLGTSTIWDRIGTGEYISDTYVQTGSDNPVAPLCS